VGEFLEHVGEWVEREGDVVGFGPGGVDIGSLSSVTPGARSSGSSALSDELFGSLQYIYERAL